MIFSAKSAELFIVMATGGKANGSSPIIMGTWTSYPEINSCTIISCSNSLYNSFNEFTESEDKLKIEELRTPRDADSYVGFAINFILLGGSISFSHPFLV